MGYRRGGTRGHAVFLVSRNGISETPAQRSDWVASNESRWSQGERTRPRAKCEKAAFLIASDRVSQFLPSSAAIVSFLIHISAGFWNTLNRIGDTYDPSNPVSSGLNRTPHNIAFGALLFWLPFAVLMTSLVGGSQTKHMIPQVLEDLRRDLNRIRLSKDQSDIEPPRIDETESLPKLPSDMYKRWSFGGQPVWQAAKYKDLNENALGYNHRRFALVGMALSFTAVAIPASCAMAISWLTYTEGFGCRAVTQLAFLLFWVFNAFADCIILRICARGDRKSSKRYSTSYYVTFVKDIICFLVTIGGLTGTALGVFNNCECWSKWPSSSGYISFLQDDLIFQGIKNRLRITFPIIIICTLSIETIIFMIVWMCFRKGLRVLKQRDIDSVLQSRDSKWNNFWKSVFRYFRRKK